LHSVFAQTRRHRFEACVIDNASCDSSADAIARAFPQIRLVRLDENIGFARANNLAATRTSGRLLLLLNPDTVVLNGAIDRLVDFASEHSEAGIWGGRTLFADGTLNPTCCWGRPTPWSVLCQAVGLSALFRGSRWFDPESLGTWKRDSVRKVDITSGCFLAIRREWWDDLGGFDPAFFMYGEEADLCLRARERGGSCLLCPDAEIIHYGGASDRIPAEKQEKLFCAKARLFAKHWPAGWARLGAGLLSLRAWTRMAGFGLLSLTDARSAGKFHAWQEVWRRRRSWHAAALEALGEDARPHTEPACSLS
jgi:GT2 family glycosyltransferase